MTLFNMLIGLLADVVSNVTDEDKEDQRIAKLQHRTMDIVDIYDKQGDGYLSEDDFDLMMDSKTFQALLKEFGVDIDVILEVKAVLFKTRLTCVFDDDSESDREDELVDTPGADLILRSTASENDDQMESQCTRQVAMLSADDFLQCVLRCHGSNVATVKDIIDLRRFLREQSLKPLTAGDSAPSNMRSEGKLAPSSKTRSAEDQ